MTKPIHMMIRALDAEQSLDFYRRAFDLNITGRFAFDDFELIYLNDKPGAIEIELTVNRGRTKAYDLGDGYGHVAFVVDDRVRARPIRARRASPRPSQRDAAEWQAVCQVFLCARPRRVQNRNFAEIWPVRVRMPFAVRVSAARGPYSDPATSPKADRDNCPMSRRFRHRPAARYP
jgi:catechol 2,3-dioxygenase-like lactoylglutathione lyase family enzyme